MVGRLYSGLIEQPVAARLVHENNRFYENDNKLKYFRIKKYFGLKKLGEKMKVKTSTIAIINKKNIKLCASEILDWDIYKFYRLKHTFLILTHRLIITRYLKKQSIKYQKK